MPRCGKLGRNYNITSRTHELQVSFKTDDWQQLKGFWLQIEGSKMVFALYFKIIGFSATKFDVMTKLAV